MIEKEAPENKINPYNFVPLNHPPNRDTSYPGIHRLGTGTYSGKMECSLEVLSPLISLDQVNFKKHELKDKNGDRLKHKPKNKPYSDWEPINVFKFLRNAEDLPIIQGASLKGMIRSVYETITRSCLTLAAVSGKHKSGKYRYDELGAHAHGECNSIENLCPACRLFGTIEGENLHCQGRVTFSDAVSDEHLVKERRYFKELSSPKPGHDVIYGRNNRQNGPIAGRKFYYHHGNSPEFQVCEHDSNDRSMAVEELAPVGKKFVFSIFLDNLTKTELGDLLLAIELDEGLAHKVGVGKAIGLGSCRIRVDMEKSNLAIGGARYEKWDFSGDNQWHALKSAPEKISPELEEILRRNKPEDGPIAYPTWNEYDKKYKGKIDAKGEFNGIATTPGQASPAVSRDTSEPYTPPPKKQGQQPVHNEKQRPSEPNTPKPPKPRPDDELAWLEEINEKNCLILVLEDVRKIMRPLNVFQGKKKLLVLGEWFILRGQKSVLSYKKQA